MPIDYLATFPVPHHLLPEMLRRLLSPIGLDPQERVDVSALSEEKNASGKRDEVVHLVMAAVPEADVGNLEVLEAGSNGVVSYSVPSLREKGNRAEFAPSVSGYDYFVASWGEHWICARLMLLARIITCNPGLLQTQIWIAPEGKALLLPVEPTLPEPALGPRGRDLQVQSAGIGHAHAGPTRVATRVLALLVGEHGGTKRQMAANTPFVPPTSLRCRGTAGAFLTQATV